CLACLPDRTDECDRHGKPWERGNLHEDVHYRQQQHHCICKQEGGRRRFCHAVRSLHQPRRVGGTGRRVTHEPAGSDLEWHSARPPTQRFARVTRAPRRTLETRSGPWGSPAQPLVCGPPPPRKRPPWPSLSPRSTCRSAPRSPESLRNPKPRWTNRLATVTR